MIREGGLKRLTVLPKMARLGRAVYFKIIGVKKLADELADRESSIKRSSREIDEMRGALKGVISMESDCGRHGGIYSEKCWGALEILGWLEGDDDNLDQLGLLPDLFAGPKDILAKSDQVEQVA